MKLSIFVVPIVRSVIYFSLLTLRLSPSHLAQNPFMCDCHLKWLADYLFDNPIETSGARCSHPRRLANKRISQVKGKKFRCTGKTCVREMFTTHAETMIKILHLCNSNKLPVCFSWWQCWETVITFNLIHQCLTVYKTKQLCILQEPKIASAETNLWLWLPTCASKWTSAWPRMWHYNVRTLVALYILSVLVF